VYGTLRATEIPCNILRLKRILLNSGYIILLVVCLFVLVIAYDMNLQISDVTVNSELEIMWK
jgi:hypothetical protein